jgi:hypothetical protein
VFSGIEGIGEAVVDTCFEVLSYHSFEGTEEHCRTVNHDGQCPGQDFEPPIYNKDALPLQPTY